MENRRGEIGNSVLEILCCCGFFLFCFLIKEEIETVSGSKVELEEGQGLCDVGAIKMCRTIISEHRWSSIT